ncbi:DNA repair protein [Shewanella sp. 10N.286.48.A6]|uniref:DNA repair protein n=1 Tax=Shewanella sp. 10N.286.48.A6 TaxID=1880833 RepID=UPI000C8264EE|nr:DNA repair protein [Shewanella sp. 10N.286.48.A6]PMI01880.1 hypothetical protein BCU55_09380 [Shewanella sp. 10N.286.48.A6]
MSDKAKFNQPILTAEDIVKKLTAASPLQASKVLIDMELHDQKASIDVLEEIRDEFNSSENLLTPLILNICDGLVGVKKLGLKQRGITASRLVNDVNAFTYASKKKDHEDAILDKQQLDQNTESNIDDKGKYVRDDIEDSTLKNNYTDEYFSEKKSVYSELEVNEDGSRKRLRRTGSDYNKSQRENGKKTTTSSANNDHNIPLAKAFEDYSGSKGITKDDIKAATNQGANFDIISEKVNKIKSGQSWSELKAKRDNLRNKTQLTKQEQETLNSIEKHVNEATFNKAIIREDEAKNAVEKHLNKTVVKNITKDTKAIKGVAQDAQKQAVGELKDKGLGELLILILKPIVFEFKDMFQNGILHGTDATSKLSAFSFRLKRASKYVMENIANVGLGALTDALKNFVRYLLNAIVDMFFGILKKALKIIVEGFSAIVQAIKILLGASSSAQKADAITKLLATTVITYIGFAFEETVLGFINKLPMGDVLSEATMIMFTGIASTIVVWILDQADLFGAKSEMRTKRVKEIFEMRIKQIKENTDAFETASIEKLAKDRLRFKSLSENLNKSIVDGDNPNEAVFNMADFMKIDLKIKSTDDFMHLLATEAKLVV